MQLNLFKKKETDAEAFERLVMPHEKQVYFTCLRMMGNAQDAADATQEALLKAWRAFPSFRRDSLASTWLYRIASNVCLDMLRRRKGETSLDTLQESGFDTPDEGAESAFSNLEKQEQKQAVAQALTLLQPDMRQAIVLRDVQGLSYEETAEVMQLPVGTVKSRLNRARNKLCEILTKNSELFKNKRV